MKNFLIPIMIISFFVAFYNQSSDHPNIFITIIAILIFMFGMMKLSAKTPSKNQEEDEG